MHEYGYSMLWYGNMHVLYFTCTVYLRLTIVKLLCYQHNRLVRGAKNRAAKRIIDSLKSILSGESSSTAKKGASTLWRATGRALIKKIWQDFSYQGQRGLGLGIGLDQYDHVLANGTACPKILTSLDIQLDWLGQLRPLCHKILHLGLGMAEVHEDVAFIDGDACCVLPRRGRRNRPPRRTSTR
jgi:hypothetical protein